MIFAVPALLKVLIVFALVLVINRVGLQLGLSLILGAILMALWFEHSIVNTFLITWKGGTNIETILLLVVIWQILALTLLMRETGMMKRMITSVRGIVPSRRAALAILPAMIGFLPMPGGAAVSAPMVDAADEDNHIDPLQKTAVNYWFRHSWEYWWPLYPGVLVALDMIQERFDIELWQFASIQMPLTIFSVSFGALFLLLPMKFGPKRELPKGKISELIMTLLPIFILIIFWQLAAQVTNPIYKSKYLPMIIGLLFGIGWVHYYGKASNETWKMIVKRKKTYLLLVVVIGVKVFSAALETPLPEGGGIVNQVQENLNALNVPELLVVMIIPFISGMVTGLAVGFVGVSFPIVLPLIASGADTGQIMSTVVLAYGFGYVGMMLSPVHVCFVVTNEYFKTQMLRAYAKLWGPALGVLLGAGIMSWLATKIY
mgnify:CR=1 FL=1